MRSGKGIHRLTSKPGTRTEAIIVAALVFTLAMFSSSAWAACTLPYQLQNGQTVSTAQVMANYNALLGCVNSQSPDGSANAVQINSGSGTFAGVGPLTNGQLVIGSTGNAPVAAALTAGSGIQIDNGPGNVTVSAVELPLKNRTGSGFGLTV